MRRAPAVAEPCPSDEELLAWVCGALTGPALSRVIAHSEACAACALVVAEAGLVLGETEPHPASRVGARPSAVFAPGQLVASRYVIERRLGRGGMGEVYVALDQELHERVALKTVATALAADARAVERLKLELRLARSVASPHVCRVFELGRHELEDASWQWFFTLQLIEGASLRHRLLRGGSPPLAQALGWAHELAVGLAAIHEQSVIHRDIKPENVMLTSAEGPAAALWVDFGLARVDLTDTRSPGLLQGTPDYAAPELLGGAIASRASDIYAFGVLLHELFTGALPFPRLESFRAPPSLRAQRAFDAPPQLPPALGALIRQCLASAPEERPASAREVGERLQEAMQEDQYLVATSPVRTRRRWLFAAAFGLTLLGGAVVLHRRVEQPPTESRLADSESSLAAPPQAPATIASSPPAPLRGASPTLRAVPRRSAMAGSPGAPSASASVPVSPPSVTDFGGRR